MVVATVAAVAVTQGFRDEGTVISAVRVGERGCPGYERGEGIPISFFLNRGDAVTAEIVDAADRDVVRTLLSDRRLEGDRRHCVPWDRRDDDGGPAPKGVYRLRVSLADADRIALAGERIRIRRAPRGEEP